MNQEDSRQKDRMTVRQRIIRLPFLSARLSRQRDGWEGHNTIRVRDSIQSGPLSELGSDGRWGFHFKSEGGRWAMGDVID